MLMIVSSLQKHITTTDFWRALSFVLKRLETIAKYLTKLPLFFTFSLYLFHLIRAALRFYSFLSKTKNKNLGDTCKFLFAVFKVSIAVIALILLGWGLVSLPTLLLSSFFAYTLLKFIHSSIVLLVSSVSYLKIDKNCIDQQWRRAQYRDNITKHACLLSAGLLFVLLTSLFNIGTTIIIWSNPLLLIADGLMAIALLAAFIYLAVKIAKNKQTAAERSLLPKQQVEKIKKFLFLFGLSWIALLVAAVAPGLGISAIIAALILLCAQDVILTIYYYFYGVDIPNPAPANLSQEQFELPTQASRDYYQTFSPAYYLQSDISEDLPHAYQVTKANKKFLLKVTLLKILALRDQREKIAESNRISRFFSSEEKLKIKEDYLLLELAWSLNTDSLGDLIELILNSSDLLATRVGILGDLELQRILGHLIFLAEQEKRSQRTQIVKPKAFYQSFWKKVGACEAISQALQVSREIETQLNSDPYMELSMQ